MGARLWVILTRSQNSFPVRDGRRVFSHRTGPSRWLRSTENHKTALPTKNSIFNASRDTDVPVQYGHGAGPRSLVGMAWKSHRRGSAGSCVPLPRAYAHQHTGMSIAGGPPGAVYMQNVYAHWQDVAGAMPRGSALHITGRAQGKASGSSCGPRQTLAASPRCRPLVPAQCGTENRISPVFAVRVE